MDIQNIDRNLLKSVLIEILKEKPHLLKDVIKELLSDKPSNEEDEARRKKIIEMIDEDFDKYDDVFKALA